MLSRVVTSVVCAAAGASAQWEHIQGELHPQDYAPDQCTASTLHPFKPRPLEFCNWHKGDACCNPLHDITAHDYFAEMTELGLACSRTEHQVKHVYLRLRYWACLACDRREPQYRFNIYDGYTAGNIVPEASPLASRFLLVLNGTTYNVSFGAFNAVTGPVIPLHGQNEHWYDSSNMLLVRRANWNTSGPWVVELYTPHDGSLAVQTTSLASTNDLRVDQVDWDSDVQVTRTGTPQVKFKWRVCQSFLNDLWNGTGLREQLFGHLYDECGLLLGGNPVIPSALFRGTGGAEALLAAIPPPLFDTAGGFDFVVVDDYATDDECAACTVTAEGAQTVCTDCSNGCSYSSRLGRCFGFRYQATPCFDGEPTALPGNERQLYDGASQPAAAGFLLFLAALTSVALV